MFSTHSPAITTAAKEAREGNRETNQQRHSPRQGDILRDRRAHCNQHRAGQCRAQIRDRTRSPQTAEIRHDQRRKAAKDDEDHILGVVEHELSEGERRGNHDCGSRRAAQCRQAGIARHFEWVGEPA